ncbi:hypothetical protein P879_05808 [Paragonimus westermani]|uniref:26S proteasome non-ATPase regulatory subunit 10 n=1 Tax=Paragonimus westermani TaxID=34504 RepID=A0A8T0DFS7_9TREM|nr:hypothetical protein P879_05808 [Paragonimus westermani]
MWDLETAKLFSAAKKGQLKVLRKLREDAPFRFVTTDSSGNSIAHWAVRGGQLKVLRFLKANFPDTLTVLNLGGQEPVHVGCVLGKMMCVAFLVNFASDVNATDARGCTPLLLAAENGHVDIAAYLLLHSANILAVDNEQNTALHLAAKAGFINMCSLLTTFGASPWNSVNSYGQTPLHLACENNQLYVVRLFCCMSVTDFGSNCVHTGLESRPFLGQADLEWEDDQGRTAMSLAYQKGLSDIADYLKMKMVLRGKNSDRSAKFSVWVTKLRKFIIGEPGRQQFGMLYMLLAITCCVYPVFWIQVT